MALHEVLAGLLVVIFAIISAAFFVSYHILKAYGAINADRDDYCQGSWSYDTDQQSTHRESAPIEA